jgi:hypothetical protein
LEFPAKIVKLDAEGGQAAEPPAVSRHLLKNAILQEEQSLEKKNILINFDVKFASCL